MKKSKHFKLAIYAVIDNQRVPTEEKLEVLETLISEKNIAEMIEAREAERQEAEKNADLP